MLNVLSLFAGIGGFDRGLERTGGFRTVAFCEIEPYCRRVLAKHWPEVPCYDDVRTLTAARLAADGIAVDAITGGFPCQDISIAGSGNGLDGERSRLWWEMHRIVAEIRPRWVLAENSPLLRGRGLERVLAALDALGYVGRWDCIPLAAFGARHPRDRLWIAAHNHASGLSVPEPAGWRIPVPQTAEERQAASERAGWASEPGLGRVVHGVPNRVDRLKSIGNAVSPVLAEALGRMILDAEGLEARHAA